MSCFIAANVNTKYLRVTFGPPVLDQWMLDHCTYEWFSGHEGHNKMMSHLTSAEQTKSIMLFPTIYVRPGSKSETKARNLGSHLMNRAYDFNKRGCHYRFVDLSMSIRDIFEFIDSAEQEGKRRADNVLYVRMKRLAKANNDYIGHHILEYVTDGI